MLSRQPPQQTSRAMTSMDGGVGTKLSVQVGSDASELERDDSIDAPSIKSPVLRAARTAAKKDAAWRKEHRNPSKEFTKRRQLSRKTQDQYRFRDRVSKAGDTTWWPPESSQQADDLLPTTLPPKPRTPTKPNGKPFSRRGSWASFNDDTLPSDSKSQFLGTPPRPANPLPSASPFGADVGAEFSINFAGNLTNPVGNFGGNFATSPSIDASVSILEPKRRAVSCPSLKDLPASYLAGAPTLVSEMVLQRYDLIKFLHTALEPQQQQVVEQASNLEKELDRYCRHRFKPDRAEYKLKTLADLTIKAQNILRRQQCQSKFEVESMLLPKLVQAVCWMCKQVEHMVNDLQNGEFSLDWRGARLLDALKQVASLHHWMSKDEDILGTAAIDLCLAMVELTAKHQIKAIDCLSLLDRPSFRNDLCTLELPVEAERMWRKCVNMQECVEAAWDKRSEVHERVNHELQGMFVEAFEKFYSFVAQQEELQRVAREKKKEPLSCSHTDSPCESKPEQLSGLMQHATHENTPEQLSCFHKDAENTFRAVHLLHELLKAAKPGLHQLRKMGSQDGLEQPEDRNRAVEKNTRAKRIRERLFSTVLKLLDCTCNMYPMENLASLFNLQLDKIQKQALQVLQFVMDCETSLEYQITVDPDLTMNLIKLRQLMEATTKLHNCFKEARTEQERRMFRPPKEDNPPLFSLLRPQALKVSSILKPTVIVPPTTVLQPSVPVAPGSPALGHPAVPVPPTTLVPPNMPAATGSPTLGPGNADVSIPPTIILQPNVPVPTGPPTLGHGDPAVPVPPTIAIQPNVPAPTGSPTVGPGDPAVHVPPTTILQPEVLAPTDSPTLGHGDPAVPKSPTIVLPPNTTAPDDLPGLRPGGLATAPAVPRGVPTLAHLAHSTPSTCLGPFQPTTTPTDPPMTTTPTDPPMTPANHLAPVPIPRPPSTPLPAAPTDSPMPGPGESTMPPTDQRKATHAGVANVLRGMRLGGPGGKGARQGLRQTPVNPIQSLQSIQTACEAGIKASKPHSDALGSKNGTSIPMLPPHSHHTPPHPSPPHPTPSPPHANTSPSHPTPSPPHATPSPFHPTPSPPCPTPSSPRPNPIPPHPQLGHAVEDEMDKDAVAALCGSNIKGNMVQGQAGLEQGGRGDKSQADDSCGFGGYVIVPTPTGILCTSSNNVSPSVQPLGVPPQMKKGSQADVTECADALLGSGTHPILASPQVGLEADAACGTDNLTVVPRGTGLEEGSQSAAQDTDAAHSTVNIVMTDQQAGREDAAEFAARGAAAAAARENIFVTIANAKQEEAEGENVPLFDQLAWHPDMLKPLSAESLETLRNTSFGGHLRGVFANTRQTTLPRSRVHQEVEITSKREVENTSKLRDPFGWALEWDELMQHATYLGKGAFGEVYCTLYCHSVVAVKTMELTAENLEDICREVHVHRNLAQHPNIVRFLGTCDKQGTVDKPSKLAIILEYCDLGSLYDIIRGQGYHRGDDRKNKFFTDYWIRLEVARGIAAALAYMHRQSPKIVHKDLTSRNVLLQDGYPWVAKVSDFGLSLFKPEDKAVAKSLSLCASGELRAYLWQAPELLKKGEKYTEKADVYSFGVILWEIITLKQPWEAELQTNDDEDKNGNCHKNDFRLRAEVKNWVRGGTERLKFDLAHHKAEGKDAEQKMVSEVENLAWECWKLDPNQRLSMDEVARKLGNIIKSYMESTGRAHLLKLASVMVQQTTSLSPTGSTEL